MANNKKQAKKDNVKKDKSNLGKKDFVMDRKTFLNWYD